MRRCGTLRHIGTTLSLTYIAILSTIGARCFPQPASGPTVEASTLDASEATIAQIHEAMLDGRITARQLVRAHLDRVIAYDEAGPRLNAIASVNEHALAQADSLDDLLDRTGALVGPLHGIPIVVSDLIDVAGLPTTLGAAALRNAVPARDAFLVSRLRQAGAIVLGKGNVAEFGLSTVQTLGSAHPGYTRNPYDPALVPGGAEGGVAVAVAASLAVAGLGSDAHGSLRGPAGHTGVVALRPTRGLSSRTGIAPLRPEREVGGPIARTVEDAVRVFEVIVGLDAADSLSFLSEGRRAQEPYTTFLVPDALDGARIGIMHRFTDVASADSGLVERYIEALVTLRQRGASTVEPVDIPALDSIGRATCPAFAAGFDAFLATLEDPPVDNLVDVLATGATHPTVRDTLEALAAVDSATLVTACEDAADDAERLRLAVRRTLLENRLDAIIYPTWSNLPRLIGDLSSPAGANAARIADATGLPAVTVPMGYVGDVPVGLDFVGDAWSDWKLIALAYSFEQATRHRRPPATAPGGLN